MLNLNQTISCPKCNGHHFSAKYEVTYLYTYKLNTYPNHTTQNKSEHLPFLFDHRDQYSPKQYVECDNCGEIYPCSFKLENHNIDFTILQKAIRGDHENNPEFLG